MYYQLVRNLLNSNEGQRFNEQFDPEILAQIRLEVEASERVIVFTPDMLDDKATMQDPYKLPGTTTISVPVLQVVHGRIFIETKQVARTAARIPLRYWIREDQIG